MERTYKKLIVWREADDLCAFTYEITGKFPSREQFGLTAQMRRSSYSVPMNIVEGNMRQTPADRSHFFVIALSSLEELHYQYHLAHRLKYINEEIYREADDRIQRVSYLLVRFKSAVSRSS